MKNPLRSLLLCAVLGGVALGPFNRGAQAALNSYLKIKGEKQGEIKGGVVRKGLENWLPIVGIHHEVVAPRDAASGLATGRRQHKPLTLTMELGKSSAQLYTAMFTDEVMAEMELAVFAPGDKLSKTPLYMVKLSKAAIVDIRMVTPEGGQTALEVDFTYQKIVWTFADGVTAQDDWETPVAKPVPAPKPMPKPKL